MLFNICMNLLGEVGGGGELGLHRHQYVDDMELYLHLQSGAELWSGTREGLEEGKQTDSSS